MCILTVSSSRFTIHQLQCSQVHFTFWHPKNVEFLVFAVLPSHNKWIFSLMRSLIQIKGANAVISMVHYYLENHGLHAVILHFNADNCTGQNKNNAVIQVHMYNYVVHVPLCVYMCVDYRLTSIFYFQCIMWRVMTGRNYSITISFLPAGHKKFSPVLALVFWKKSLEKQMLID